MACNDGGPAFPTDEYFDERRYGCAPGMSLRDYFAGQVISQCQINVIREEPAPDAEVIRVYAERYARTAYAIADAMLQAREAKPGQSAFVGETAPPVRQSSESDV